MDWDALARAVIARRVELGYPTRRTFIDASQISARTVGDIETGRRSSYARDTLARLERALLWEPDSVQAVLDGGDPKPALETRLAGLALDPRALERYGDDLELLQIIADAQLSPADALRVTLQVRKRRAEQHRHLVEELRALIEKGRSSDVG